MMMPYRLVDLVEAHSQAIGSRPSQGSGFYKRLILSGSGMDGTQSAVQQLIFMFGSRSR